MHEADVDGPLRRNEGQESIQAPLCAGMSDRGLVDDPEDSVPSGDCKETTGNSSSNSLPILAESGELPTAYPETLVVLMPVEPCRAYVYWEVPSNEVIEHPDIAAKPEESGTTLRIQDVSPIGSNQSKDQTAFITRIGPAAGSCYVHSLIPGRSYFAEIGHKFPDETFVAIAQSELVTMPTAAPRPEVVPSYMIVSEEYRIVSFVPRPSSLASRQILALTERSFKDEGTSWGAELEHKPPYDGSVSHATDLTNLSEKRFVSDSIVSS